MGFWIVAGASPAELTAHLITAFLSFLHSLLSQSDQPKAYLQWLISSREAPPPKGSIASKTTQPPGDQKFRHMGLIQAISYSNHNNRHSILSKNRRVTCISSRTKFFCKSLIEYRHRQEDREFKVILCCTVRSCLTRQIKMIWCKLDSPPPPF